MRYKIGFVSLDGGVRFPSARVVNIPLLRHVLRFHCRLLVCLLAGLQKTTILNGFGFSQNSVARWHVGYRGNHYIVIAISITLRWDIGHEVMTTIIAYSVSLRMF